jgi:DNA primase
MRRASCWATWPAWDLFSAEDHALLCQLPPPHGPLFVWLENELHDRGPQPWGAMREGLRDHESEELAVRLMADPQHGHADDDRAAQSTNCAIFCA